MGREEVLPTIVTDLSAHPAVAAWTAADGRRDQVIAVTPLKAQRKAGHKSGVYRLHLQNETHDVVAKRCRRQTAAVERVIYERVLPRIGAPVLEYFGSLKDSDERYLWIFLEDAGQEEVGEDDGLLVARWLGRLHACAADIVSDLGLPQRGAEHYREHLTGALQRLSEYIGASRFSSEDRQVLEHVRRQCRAVAERWPAVLEFLDRMPRTLAHGDFVPKNMRMRGEASSRHLVVLDWETAGIATPAADLAELAKQFGSGREEAMTAYQASAEKLWEGFSGAELRRIGQFGLLLRLLASIDWTSHNLAHPWVDKPMWKLRAYEKYLAGVMNYLGWEG